MALQMQYTDSRGVSYPASYWVVDDIFTSKRMLQGSCLVRGWRDAVAASQGLDTISERPVSATGAAFIAMLTATLTPGGPNIVALAYGVAKQDEFFKDAKDV